MDLELAGQHFPQATQIVDLYHAREHLHDLAKLLEFMLGDHKGTGCMHGSLSWTTGTGAICAAARTFPLAGRKASDLATALGYSSTTPTACNTRASSLACSSAPAPWKRLQSDRRPALQTVRHAMDLAGAYGILTLRCLDASDRREQTWAGPGHAAAGAA